MKKLLVVGIGGVGGYYGGKLSKHYEESDELGIYFLARGENAETIKKFGLQVKDGGDLFLTRPHAVFTSAQDAGTMDYILICTKSYHLDAILPALKHCVSEQTLILPLLNGVEPAKKIQAFFPTNLVCEGCTYMVSQLTHPGKVDNSGAVQQIYYGAKDASHKSLMEMQKIFDEAKIDAELRTDIESVVWEKYIFIAAIATSTSFYNQTIGAVIEDAQKYRSVLSLIAEVTAVANKLKIKLPDDIEQLTADKIQKMPYGGTSSMHRDFSKGGATELENLCGYVIREGRKEHVPVPTFEKMYAALAKQ